MIQIHLDTVDSTNTYALRYLRENPLSPEETVLITAEYQTAGRGRTGKKFSSERGNGLFMSLIVPSGKSLQDSLMMTPSAAVGVVGALEEIGVKGLGIKWVNDIFLGERKICGILTESVINPDSGCMEHAVVGIGININSDMEKMPEELRQTAGFLCLSGEQLENLPQRIAEHVFQEIWEALFQPGGKEKMLSVYREKSCILGKEVTWEENGMVRNGKAVDINEEGNLVVWTGSGRTVLSSGMVSIRPVRELSPE